MLKYPWNDYSGRLSPLKLGVFLLLFVPAGWVAFGYATHSQDGRLGLIYHGIKGVYPVHT